MIFELVRYGIYGFVAWVVVSSLLARWQARPKVRHARLKRTIARAFPNHDVPDGEAFVIQPAGLKIESLSYRRVELTLELPDERVGWHQLVRDTTQFDDLILRSDSVTWTVALRTPAELATDSARLIAFRESLLSRPRSELLLEAWERGKDPLVASELAQRFGDEEPVMAFCDRLVDVVGAATPYVALNAAQRASGERLFELTQSAKLPVRSRLAVLSWLEDQGGTRLVAVIESCIDDADTTIMQWGLDTALARGLDVTDRINRRISEGSLLATKASATMRNGRTVQALIDCLSTDEGVARYLAAERLGEEATPDEIPALLDVMHVTTSDSDLRNRVAGAITKIRERFGLPSADGGLTVAESVDAGLSIVAPVGGELSESAVEEFLDAVDAN